MHDATPTPRSKLRGRRADCGPLHSAGPATQQRSSHAWARLRLPRLARRRLALGAVLLLLTAAASSAYLWRETWTAWTRQLAADLQQRVSERSQPAGEHHGVAEELPGAAHHTHSHAEDAGHDHADPCADSSIELSPTARKNVGLELMTVQLSDFDRTINVPAVVTGRPGRTTITVSAPMNGIVTRVYPIRGQAVDPGDPLFELRLTHEDLVNAQSAFLETLERLDVIKREIARLKEVTASGAVAGKTLLARRYEQQQTEARLRAQRQALVLHGLSEQQLQQIEATRHLIQRVTVRVPQPADEPSAGGSERVLQMARLEVGPGQHVQVGDVLCVLRDHAVLYIEGKAFEEDFPVLNLAVQTDAPITALVEADGQQTQTVGELKILYIDDEVELKSRELRFYVRLPNQLVRDERTQQGHRFVSWRFKPGQRVQLLVPVERWEDRIVLPIEAVVQDGAEWFVFRVHKDHFDRKPVHVEYRDQRWAVLADDGALFPGDVVVASGAYQMHVAMKNKSGAAVDPHAGHQH